MTVNFRKITVFALVIAVMGMALAVQAEEKNIEGLLSRVRQTKLDKIIEDLDLSPEQEAQIKEFRKTQREKMKGLQEVLKNSRQALRAELEKQDLDREAINEYSQKIQESLAKLVDQRVKGVMAIKDILTPEQFKAFQEKSKEARENKKSFRKELKKRWRKNHYPD